MEGQRTAKQVKVVSESRQTAMHSQDEPSTFTEGVRQGHRLPYEHIAKLETVTEVSTIMIHEKTKLGSPCRKWGQTATAIM